MKQVTMESVKQRIADLERVSKDLGGLSLISEFELACLRELVAVTEQRDALVVESSQIKAMNDCLAEELRSYESDGAFEGPDMHLLWWKCEFKATEAEIAALRAEGVEMAISHLIEKFKGTGIGVPVMALEHLARQLRESKGAYHE